MLYSVIPDEKNIAEDVNITNPKNDMFLCFMTLMITSQDDCVDFLVEQN